MYQRGSQWKVFHKIWYLALLWKSVEKIQSWWKLRKNICHFSWRPTYVSTQRWTLNRHKSALFEWNCIGLSETRYTHYAKTSKCYVIRSFVYPVLSIHSNSSLLINSPAITHIRVRITDHFLAQTTLQTKLERCVADNILISNHDLLRGGADKFSMS
jgi:hypothetical protein